jgi:lysophospholipase L1-like esterase
MELIKKVVWTGVFLLLLGGFAYTGLIVRNAITAKNYTDYWQQKALDGGDFVYIALGDSNAVGVGASSIEKSYVGLIRSKIEETTGRPVKIVNLAVADADIENVMNLQLPKVASYKPDLVTISVGSKDIDKYDPATVVVNFKKLLELLPDNVSYLADIPAVPDVKKREAIERVNLQIKEAGFVNGVNMVPLFEATTGGIKSASYYDWDFAHPNDLGHQLWAETFLKVIQ